MNDTTLTTPTTLATLATTAAHGVMAPALTLETMYGTRPTARHLSEHDGIVAVPPCSKKPVATTESSGSAAVEDESNAHPGGRRMIAEPRLLGVLMGDTLTVRHRAGTGPGRHAFHKEFKNDPFPLKRGAVVRFDVRFDRGFEWGCRGKVGGLFVGPGSADGGEHSKNGASLRLMWDAGGGAYAYVYMPRGSEPLQPAPLDQRSRKGTSVFKDAFKRALVGTGWHTVQLGIKLNTVGKHEPNADGELLFSIDDKQRVLRNVVWRLRDNLAIEQFALSLFHGGPCRATRTSTSAVRNARVFSW